VQRRRVSGRQRNQVILRRANSGPVWTAVVEWGQGETAEGAAAAADPVLGKLAVVVVEIPVSHVKEVSTTEDFGRVILCRCVLTVELRMEVAVAADEKQAWAW